MFRRVMLPRLWRVKSKSGFARWSRAYRDRYVRGRRVRPGAALQPPRGRQASLGGTSHVNARRVLAAGVVAAIAATTLLLGGTLRGEGGDAQAGAVVTDVAGERLQAGFGAGDTTDLIQSLQHSLREQPESARALTLLGLAYQQRARETGDASYYPRSEQALRRALELDPQNSQAVAGLGGGGGAPGSLALARHRFGDALAFGRRAQQLAPYVAFNHGVIGDALIELGRYDQAFREFDRMAALKPGLASYTRVSYARELLGRPQRALRAMRLAVDAAGPRGEPAAWTRVQLGKLLFSLGRVEPAATQFRIALAAFPGYVHALDALAHAEAARGRIARAISLERRAVEQNPFPQFVGSLGDLLRLAGRPGRAREQYALVGAIERLLRANGVRTDLESAQFNLDHGLRLRESLELARRARAARPSIESDDLLAWALERNGRCREALPHSQHALRLGTLDALKFFHRGMIERCLGREPAAQRWFRRAVALNPHFSLVWAGVAQKRAA
jgi:tetratricopeptide (TPR) repeat protein